MCPSLFRRSNSTAISVTVETSVNTTTLDHLEFLHPFRPDLRYPWFTYYLLYILGGIHLFFSIWMLLEYFLTNWPNFSLPKILYTNILVSAIRRSVSPFKTPFLVIVCSQHVRILVDAFIHHLVRVCHRVMCYFMVS